MTEQQIEKIFSNWYDKRKDVIPPAAYESWKAGWEAAMKQINEGSKK